MKKKFHQAMIENKNDLKIILPIALIFVFMYILNYYLLNFKCFGSVLLSTITTCIIYLIYRICHQKIVFQFKKVRLCLLVIILLQGNILGAVLFTDNVGTNGQLYFSNYPTLVFIRVEKPLSAEYATFFTLITLESINQTFGYRMILANVESFEDDQIESYNSSAHNRNDPEIERANLRLKTVWNGHVEITITFYHGKGRYMQTWAGPSNAGGTSNGGDEINIYCPELSDLYLTNKESVLYHIKTLHHEFGHSFGLPHNAMSPIMFTSEKSDNLANASRPDLNVDMNETDISPIDQYALQNSSVQDVFYNYIFPNIRIPILLNKTYVIPINPNLIYYDYILDSWPSDTITYVQMLKISVGESVYYSIKQFSFSLTDFSRAWLPEELQRC